MASRKAPATRRTTSSKTRTTTAPSPSKENEVSTDKTDVSEDVKSDDDLKVAQTEESANGDHSNADDDSPVNAPESDVQDGQAVQVTEGANNPAVGVTRASWKTDQYGNPADGAEVAMPPRGLVPERTFYEFDYDSGEQKNTIVANEDVYVQIIYPGSSRKGRSLAYHKGTVLHEAILDAVDTEN